MKKLNILYLDDDLDFLDLYSELFQHWGFQVDAVAKPKRALLILTKRVIKYNVLLVEYKMSDVNGIDFLLSISKYGYFGIEKIALFSSMVHDRSVQEELNLKIPNFNQYIHCIEKKSDKINELKAFLDIHSKNRGIL